MSDITNNFSLININFSDGFSPVSKLFDLFENFGGYIKEHTS